MMMMSCFSIGEFCFLAAAKDLGAGQEVERADFVIGSETAPVFRCVLQKLAEMYRFGGCHNAPLAD